MGFGGANMQKLMRQAQKMQEDIARVQAELKELRVEGSAGGNMVKATVSGSGELLDIQINREVVDPEDVEMLQDLVLTAVKDAMAKAAATASEQMAAVTGGMNIPGLR